MDISTFTYAYTDAVLGMYRYICTYNIRRQCLIQRALTCHPRLLLAPSSPACLPTASCVVGTANIHNTIGWIWSGDLTN